ncbi:MAG: hypothetical protein R3B52_01770 [Candidatus Paceibacterota bacterium]
MCKLFPDFEEGIALLTGAQARVSFGKNLEKETKGKFKKAYRKRFSKDNHRDPQPYQFIKKDQAAYHSFTWPCHHRRAAPLWKRPASSTK